MDPQLIKALAHEGTLERTLQVLKPIVPAAGAQWSLTVPGDQVWIVRSVAATLVTDANVATRSVALTVDNQTDVISAAVANTTQAATLSQRFVWMTDYSTSPTLVAGGFVCSALQELPLPGGFVLRSVMSNVQVGDQWSAIAVTVESILRQPMGVHEYREAIELGERISTSMANPGGL